MTSFVVPSTSTITPSESSVDVPAALAHYHAKQNKDLDLPQRLAKNGSITLLDVGNAADQAPIPLLSMGPKFNKMSRSMVADNTALVETAPTNTSNNTLDATKTWHTHHVNKSDSLLSLSIRYSVKVNDIKKWNKLPNSNRKIMVPSLKIKINPNTKELIMPSPLDQMISKLSHATKLSYDESKYYVGDGTRSYEACLLEAQDDLAWEEKNNNVLAQDDGQMQMLEESVPLINKKNI
jgi:LysM repeat protein